MPTDYEPGPAAHGVRCRATGAGPVAILICFESAFPALAREYARRGADALVVLTNNRSYRRSANSAQHLAMGQFRAAETGRPLLQAGHLRHHGAWSTTPGRCGTRPACSNRPSSSVRSTTYRGRTPYAVAGEWALLASAVLLAAALVAARRRRSQGPLMGDGGEAQP